MVVGIYHFTQIVPLQSELRCIRTEGDGCSYLQVTDDAVGFFPSRAAGGRCLQVLLAPHQQVPSCRVTAAMGTAMGVVRLLGGDCRQDYHKGEKHMRKS